MNQNLGDAHDPFASLTGEQNSSDKGPSTIQTATANPQLAPNPNAKKSAGWIPYKNPRALIAYYVSLFALIPFVGLLFSVPAIVFGILALRASAKRPEIKGVTHAWVGIVLGASMTIAWCGIAIRLIFALMVQPYPG